MTTLNANHWFVYILLADDQRLYTGITTNINQRWQKHRRGQGAKFFHGRKPLTLCYLEGELNKSTASQREYQLKQLSRKQKWQLILKHYGPHQKVANL